MIAVLLAPVQKMTRGVYVSVHTSRVRRGVFLSDHKPIALCTVRNIIMHVHVLGGQEVRYLFHLSVK